MLQGHVKIVVPFPVPCILGAVLSQGREKGTIVLTSPDLL